MSEVKHLLIVAHNPSPNTQKLVEAALRGAMHEDIEGVEVKHIPPLQAVPDDVLWADAIILGTTENFGYMSGALKFFLDRVFYEIVDDTKGLPYALLVKAGNDGTGATSAVERIVSGLDWKQALPPLIVKGDATDADRDAVRELGLTFAAGVELGMF